MIDPNPTPALRFLLAIDPEAFADTDPASLARFVDRVSAGLHEGVLVQLSTNAPGLPGMPEADYQVSTDGSLIVRLPAGDVVADWPPSGTAEGGVDEASALMYLTEAHLLSPFDTYAVVAADGPALAEFGDNVIVVGGSTPPSSGLWVPDADTMTVVDRLDERGLFARPHAQARDLCDLAFEQAIETLHRNITPYGITAASLEDNALSAHDANYAAVWARDGIISGLWSLCLEDDEVLDAFRRTLELLARHQTPGGQIPANVRVPAEKPDYSGIGGIAAVDAVIWFVIGVARYAYHTRDGEFAARLRPNVDAAMTWLVAHDSNNDSLLEIPESSDWMDLFPRSYNVMLDEVLWQQACLDYAALLEAMGDDGTVWRDRSARVRDRVLELFWPSGAQLLDLAGSAAGRFAIGEGSYLLSQVTPFGYSWRCDVLGNLLAALVGLLDGARRQRLFTFLWGAGINSPFPVRCLYPPVLSGAEDWKDYFIVNFLNLPNHYHNGGIWPFIGGLWVLFLEDVGSVELAHRELVALAEACRGGMHGEWEFNEWLHGETGRPMGKAQQAWSAASYVLAYSSLRAGKRQGVFLPLEPERFAG